MSIPIEAKNTTKTFIQNGKLFFCTEFSVKHQNPKPAIETVN